MYKLSGLLRRNGLIKYGRMCLKGSLINSYVRICLLAIIFCLIGTQFG